MFKRTDKWPGAKCNGSHDDHRNQTIQERLASDLAAAALISVALPRGVARKPYAVAPFNAENGRVARLFWMLRTLFKSRPSK